jgi:hypothetical protein
LTATLKVTREDFAIEFRRGAFEITVDDRAVGSIDYRDTVKTPVDPGPHTLRIRKGRYHSPAREFVVATATRSASAAMARTCGRYGRPPTPPRASRSC